MFSNIITFLIGWGIYRAGLLHNDKLGGVMGLAFGVDAICSALTCWRYGSHGEGFGVYNIIMFILVLLCIAKDIGENDERLAPCLFISFFTAIVIFIQFFR